MKRTILLLATGIALSVAPVRADFNWELNLNGGYTNNLLSESIGYDDNHSGTRAIVRYYPLSQLQFNATSEYTYYGQLYNLSNWVGRVGGIWIPTPPESKLNLYVDGSFDFRRYRHEFSEFDNNNGAAKVSLGYALTPVVRVRSGLRLNSTEYVKTDTTTDADYQQGELFAGVNVTILGSNSLDLETGLGVTRYSSIDAVAHPVFDTTQNPFGQWIQQSPTELLGEGNFSAFYISPRISRPIGDKTGVSLTYTWRQFNDINNSVVMGYTTDFLSPWASFFDGSSVQFRLKTLLVPHMIVTAGYGYWDKTFLKSTAQRFVDVEQFPGYSVPELRWIDPKDATPRVDYMNRIYLGIQRPFRIGNGLLIEPSLNFDYTDNNSSDVSFDYNATAISAGIIIRP